MHYVGVLIVHIYSVLIGFTVCLKITSENHQNHNVFINNHCWWF